MFNIQVMHDDVFCREYLLLVLRKIFGPHLRVGDSTGNGMEIDVPQALAATEPDILFIDGDRFGERVAETAKRQRNTTIIVAVWDAGKLTKTKNVYIDEVLSLRSVSLDQLVEKLHAHLPTVAV